MKNSYFKYFIIITTIFILFSIGCSNKNSKLSDIYYAEKMFFEAGKVHKNILINPDIANPEEYEKAEQAYRAIIDKFNEKSDNLREIKGIVQRCWLTIAELRLLQKKYTDAIEIYQEIIEKSAFDRELCALAQYSIASSFEKYEKFDDAIEVYQRVVQDYPPVLSDTLLPNYNIMQTPIYIARLYRQKKESALADQQYEKAREYYEGVVKQWPNSIIALAAQNQIAISYGDQGEWEKSVAVLSDIISKYQNSQQLFNIMFTLGNIYQQQLRQPDKALNIYQQILQKYSKSKDLGRIHLTMGGIDLTHKKYNEAREDFKYVLDNYRDDNNSCIQAQLAIAKSYELENNWNKALNEYQWLVENYPRSLQALDIPLYIAENYRNQQEHELAQTAYESATKRYQQVIEQYPKTMLAAVAQDYLATCYIRLEKWREASAVYQLLSKMELPVGKQINTYLLLGSIYEEKLKDTQKAIDVYSDLLQRFPKLPNAQSIKERTEELQQNLAHYQQTNTPPMVSEVNNTSILSASSVEINWDRNMEDDFDWYKLIRSESPGVSSSDTVVAEIFNQQQANCVDKNLKEGNTYYYRLYVHDKGGLSSASKEVSVKLEVKKILTAVKLQAVSTNWSTASLKWSQSQEQGFDSYKIYRSSTAGVNLASTLIKSVYDKSTTQFEDNDLKEITTYYYKVYVYNSSGTKMPSNEVKITTVANAPPAAVVLEKPLTINNTTIQLSWSPNNDDDFSTYQIYRSERSPVSLKSSPLWISSDKLINNHKDTGLKSGKTYYYKIVVYDKGGLYSASNEVAIKL